MPYPDEAVGCSVSKDCFASSPAGGGLLRNGFATESDTVFATLLNPPSTSSLTSLTSKRLACRGKRTPGGMVVVVCGMQCAVGGVVVLAVLVCGMWYVVECGGGGGGGGVW